jgi:hypothetical protein
MDREYASHASVLSAPNPCCLCELIAGEAPHHFVVKAATCRCELKSTGSIRSVAAAFFVLDYPPRAICHAVLLRKSHKKAIVDAAANCFEDIASPHFPLAITV